MLFYDDILAVIRRWLCFSPHVHIREREVKSLVDVVDLIDRFVGGHMRYALEWDDFISWPHKNEAINSVVESIGVKEGLLFSKNKSDRLKYIDFLIKERNRIAETENIPPRLP